MVIIPYYAEASKKKKKLHHRKRHSTMFVLRHAWIKVTELQLQLRLPAQSWKNVEYYMMQGVALQLKFYAPNDVCFIF